jgi:hypothetical protein
LATYHFRLKHGSRASGRSAKGHALYLLREQQYAYRIHELSYVEHGNLPSWAKDQPLVFWQAADQHERSNGRLYTELEVALPRELTKEQRFYLVQDFVQNTLLNRHPYTLVIHESQALDGKLQPHFHLMFSTRALDGIERELGQFFRRANLQEPELGGAAKALKWYKKERLLELRLLWEQAANLALEQAGHTISIDCRTLQEQGINRQPEPVLGPYYSMLLKQGVITERAQQVLELREQRRFEQSVARQVVRTVQEYERLRDEYRTLATAKDALEEKDIRLGNILITLENHLTYKAPLHYQAAIRMASDQLWGRAEMAFKEQVAVSKQRLNQFEQQHNQQLSWQKINPIRLHQELQSFELKRQLRVAIKRYEAFQQQVLTLERLQQRDELASQLWQQSKQVKQQHQQYFAEREQNATQLQSLSKRVEQVFERLTGTVEQLQSLGVRFDRALNPVIKAQAQAVGQQEGQVLDQQQEWGFSQ